MTYTAPNGVKWSSTPLFQSNDMNNISEPASLTALSRDNIKSRRDAFLLLFDEQIVQWNIDATNLRGRYTASLYATALEIKNGTLSIHDVQHDEATKEDIIELTMQTEDNLKRRSKWIDFTRDEILAIYGFYLLMGVKKEKNIEDAISLKGNRILSFPAAGIATSKNRLRIFTNAFGLTHPQRERDLHESMIAVSESYKNDKIAKVRDIINRLRDNYVKAYIPETDLVVDEQMVGYKGRTSLKQHMPNKPDKYGIKLWALVDRNQYTLNLQVYAGQEGFRRVGSRMREVDQAHRVVMDMVSVLDTSDRKHHITTDRFFTSLKLADDLLKRNITLTGTIRENKLEVPEELRKQRRNGESNRRTVNSVIRCVKPNKLVHILGSAHNHSETEVVGPKKIPQLNDKYNKSKHFVDIVDNMLKKYTAQRPTMKWNFALLIRLIDITALNAYKLVSNGINNSMGFKSLDIARVIDISSYSNDFEPHQVTGVSHKRVRCNYCPRKSGNKTRYKCKCCARPACGKHGKL
ncbi:piggyBac transposable element-derived protein 4-like protein [Leptotrombidium deliense]|uniref:PiggyBac transposable element-derived protein 4-like protein n=1 Tax=Leptotrombidium deliense TaxID=299467 RepID=A0A443S711_9ACAR|nr:piggyBac transposable element-derived protein 4-like protein [Leptotrombidium deliense]